MIISSSLIPNRTNYYRLVSMQKKNLVKLAPPPYNISLNIYLLRQKIQHYTVCPGILDPFFMVAYTYNKNWVNHVLPPGSSGPLASLVHVLSRSYGTFLHNNRDISTNICCITHPRCLIGRLYFPYGSYPSKDILSESEVSAHFKY